MKYLILHIEIMNLSSSQKNGYSDLVVMSSELYDKFRDIYSVDQAITESELEMANGAEAIDASTVFANLEKKYSDSLPQTGGNL